MFEGHFQLYLQCWLVRKYKLEGRKGYLRVSVRNKIRKWEDISWAGGWAVRRRYLEEPKVLRLSKWGSKGFESYEIFE